MKGYNYVQVLLSWCDLVKYHVTGCTAYDKLLLLYKIFVSIEFSPLGSIDTNNRNIFRIW